MSEWTKEQQQASAASVKKMLRTLERHGPLLAGDLAKIVGLPGLVTGQLLKRPVKAGTVIAVRRWGYNGETMYALPGQPIPSGPVRQPPTTEERQQMSALDDDHDRWFAALRAEVATRPAVVDTMRARV